MTRVKSFRFTLIVLVLLFWGAVLPAGAFTDAYIVEYCKTFFKTSDVVLVGTFMPEKVEAINQVPNTFYQKINVEAVLKGDELGSTEILRLDNAYNLLGENKDSLVSASNESRTLRACLRNADTDAALEEDYQYYCKLSKSEMTQRLEDPSFMVERRLGNFIEQGWNLTLEEDQRYLFFLASSENKLVDVKAKTLDTVYEILRPVLHMIPIQNESGDEIKSILLSDKK